MIVAKKEFFDIDGQNKAKYIILFRWCIARLRVDIRRRRKVKKEQS